MLDHWFDMLRREFAFTLLIADPESPDWTGHVMGAADLILFVTDSDSPVPAPGELAPGERKSGAFDPQRWLIRLHPADCALPSPSLNWLEALEPDFLLNVRIGTAAHAQRLARLIARRALGVTLSGGAARGFAHFGTIIALRDYGFPIDYLSGASAGSLAALLVAQEQDDLRAQSKDRVEQLMGSH